MKRGISFKQALKLSLSGKWTTRIITVILTAFSFALFGLSSACYTYDEFEYQVCGYGNYLKNVPVSYILYEYENHEDKTGAYFTNDGISRLEDETGLSFSKGYDKLIGTAQGLYSDMLYEDYGDTDKFTYGTEKYDPKYEIYREFSSAEGIVGKEAQYKEFGFDLITGRYPKERNEIAVSEQQLLYFQGVGYRENKKAPVQEIEKAEDLIGKRINGNTIVGVVYTQWKEEEEVAYRRESILGGRIFFTEQWAKEAYPFPHATMLFAPKKTDDKTVRAVVRTTLEMLDYSESKTGSTGVIPFVGASMFYPLVEIDDPNQNNFWSGGKHAGAIWIASAGFVFGIFAIALNAYLMSASLRFKKKNIGILKSLGATNGQIARVFLLEAAFVAVCSFLLATAMDLTFYYAMLPIAASPPYYVSELIFGGWNVLILAGFSLVVPFVSVFLPLFLFLRRSCVEMITDSEHYVKKKQKNAGIC